MATTKQLWQQNNNRLYWEKREQKQRELYMMEEAQQQKELEKIYAEMYRHAEDEINRFYGKYADAEGIDITEAKKRVTQADIEAYEALAKEYVKNKDFSDRANAEMRLYNATMKINRLEMLKARIGVYLVAGINDIDQYYEKVITDRTRQEIERQAGILGETVSVADTVKRAENIVNASFFNATYSERIWSHQDRLRSMINIELQKGLIAGIGSRQMASNIRKEYDVSLADAHRLMVTELRRVQTDVAMDSYKASGVEKYVYMAVNPRACPICREIDGNVYNVSDAEPAKNAPPMHPRCHCTTAPYVDEDEYNAWLNYLNQGGRTSDWNNMSPAERQRYANPVLQSEPQTADTFTPAKTKAEAEEYAKQFADDVDYSGLSLSNANAINKRLSVLTSKYPINKLGQIVSGGGRGVMSANYRKLTINGKKLGKTLADEATNFELNKAMNKASIRLMEERWAGKKMPFAVESDIEKLKRKIQFERWGVHSMYDNHVEVVVTHEYGHILSDQYFGMINQERANPNYNTPWNADLRNMNKRWEDAWKKAKGNGDIYKISEYASTKPSEFFAECFALREMGGTLPDYVESLMEEVLSNGIM